MRIDTETLSVPAQVGLTKGPVSGSDRRPFAESRAALARGTPRPRNTKDRPVGGLHVPADRGRSKRLATLILPDNPPSRQVENAGFRQRRSYVACALPLFGGLFRPEGEACPFSNRWSPRSPARARPPG